MKCKVIGESGYEQAMLGISLSWASNVERSKEIAPNLAHKQGGHAKFLESIMIWIDVTAPRYWHQEADTYRISTKQSESTMHTISKRILSQDDFENPIYESTLENLNKDILFYQETKNVDIFLRIKDNLPEGFLQRRIWCMSYKTFQNLYYQRKTHKLKIWKTFLEKTLSEIEHPEFIVKQS